MYHLRLYVVGQTPSAIQTIRDTTALLNGRFSDRYSLEITDLLKHPHLAEADGVFATPALIKLSPSPVSRVTGRLGDGERVLSELGLGTGLKQTDGCDYAVETANTEKGGDS